MMLAQPHSNKPINAPLRQLKNYYNGKFTPSHNRDDLQAVAKLTNKQTINLYIKAKINIDID
jgi:hypothetical protein